MSHVADGDLHAYLDGALDLYPDERARRIRDHLDGCEECAARLARADSLRNRVAEVLSLADPVLSEAPSLEELRRLARVSGDPGEKESVSVPGTGRRWLRSSGWAATVVLAVTAGWFFGQGGGPGVESRTSDLDAGDGSGAAAALPSAASGGMSERASGPATPSVPSASVVEGAPMREPNPRGRGGVVPDGAGESPALPSDDDRSHVTASADVVEASNRRRSAANERIVLPDEPRWDTSATSDAGARLGLDRIAVLDSLLPTEDSAASAGAAGDPADRVAAGATPFPPVTGATDTVARTDGVPVLTNDLNATIPLSTRSMEVSGKRPARVEGRGSAIRTLGEMIVPDLEVVSVEWTFVAPGMVGLKVVQLLDAGGTIELRFGGLAGEPAPVPESVRQEALPDGVNQVVTELRQGWLVARARIDRERLRALVAEIR